MWSWIGPFLVFYFSNQGYEEDAALQFGNTTGALIIIIGRIATYLGGRLSDKFGRGQTLCFFLLVLCAHFLLVG
jgi:MFS family permease